jgi:hypothetical protein
MGSALNLNGPPRPLPLSLPAGFLTRLRVVHAATLGDDAGTFF